MTTQPEAFDTFDDFIASLRANAPTQAAEAARQAADQMRAAGVTVDQAAEDCIAWRLLGTILENIDALERSAAPRHSGAGAAARQVH